MPHSTGTKALLALGIVAIGALAGLLLHGDLQTSLLMLVCGVAAVLLATASSDAMGPLDAAPAAAEGPGIGEVLEAIAEPVLLIADRRVVAANAPARTLLGQHILGEDVRVAIRHPAAAEALLSPGHGESAEPIHLVGLGTRDQRWEMRVETLSDGRRIVQLSDHTGSYATERIRVDFVANASHELRTPLASLLGYVETLEDGAGDDPELRARFLKIMHGEARRMQRLIDDLISLSRIEAEKYRAPDNPVAMDELIDEVCLELSGAPRAGDVVTEIAETQKVRGDASQLSQLLHNVIGNAMKYGREGTPILVRLAPEGDSMVRLSVTDQGDGIPPEHLPRLTERFYRVDPGRSRTIGGTGLGLSIVKHIVERHRGRFDIASTVGQGTTVSVMLPVHAVIKT
ncbi:ATP-binding protein [Sphingomonas sp. HITSZ_GF]|uniref:ATP-binding protein n=1 Tax=Sphingomonas sp. HITSZ_GF TaxID=3037247 RepID=UPI00240E77C4|nr:ATP-binding protein [Sphingomonas sp. HITSZ_GF]MDG2535829.1 ATP-binding protein [Sphingomonas sp. HITSZ_GF]